MKVQDRRLKPAGPLGGLIVISSGTLTGLLSNQGEKSINL